MARQLRRAGLMTAPPSSARPSKTPPRLVLSPGITQRGRGIRQFLGEVRAELRKVVWPTREELLKLTSMVIGMCVVVGFLLGGIDFAFAQLLQALLR